MTKEELNEARDVQRGRIEDNTQGVLSLLREVLVDMRDTRKELHEMRVMVAELKKHNDDQDAQAEKIKAVAEKALKGVVRKEVLQAIATVGTVLVALITSFFQFVVKPLIDKWW